MSLLNRFLSHHALVILLSQQALAVGIHDYRLQRTFLLPAAGPGSGGNVQMDSLPDGRVIALNGPAVFVETAPQSGVFNNLGNVAGFAPGFGPSFIAVSPDGTRAAAGTNGEGSVVVFDVANPASAESFPIFDNSGEWLDDNRLAIANFGSVQVINTATDIVSTIITIGGASGGVAVDTAGNLYTGNGFDIAAGGTDTGWIKAFAQADWETALATNTPIDFETAGIAVADLLTATSIGFDASGNMHVGGGDFYGTSGDLGYAALVSASALADALSNPQATPPISAASPVDVLRKFISPPDTVDSDLPPFWNFNAATDELLLGYVFGDGTMYVYAIPEPASILLIAIGAAALVLRRHR